MSKIDMEFDDNAFQAHLKYIRDGAIKEILGVVRNGAQEIENRAKMTAPKRYGFLRASIGHTDPSLVEGSPKNAPAVVGVWREEDDGAGYVAVEVGSGMKYARYMEYYQAQVSLKTKNRLVVHMREGQSPYLAPAFAEVRPLVVKDLKEFFKELLHG